MRNYGRFLFAEQKSTIIYHLASQSDASHSRGSPKTPRVFGVGSSFLIPGVPRKRYAFLGWLPGFPAKPQVLWGAGGDIVPYDYRIAVAVCRP